MPMVYGLKVRWTHKKEPCGACGEIDLERYMIEGPKKLWCSSCFETFRDLAKRGVIMGRGENNDSELVTLVGGQRIFAHAKKNCQGEFCTIHHFSDHHMVEWPQHWRNDTGVMERICEHGIGHPDPDDRLISGPNDERNWAGVHGCDGCCSKPQE